MVVGPGQYVINLVTILVVVYVGTAPVVRRGATAPVLSRDDPPVLVGYGAPPLLTPAPGKPAEVA